MVQYQLLVDGAKIEFILGSCKCAMLLTFVGSGKFDAMACSSTRGSGRRWLRHRRPLKGVSGGRKSAEPIFSPLKPPLPGPIGLWPIGPGITSKLPLPLCTFNCVGSGQDQGEPKWIVKYGIKP